MESHQPIGPSSSEGDRNGRAEIKCSAEKIALGPRARDRARQGWKAVHVFLVALPAYLHNVFEGPLSRLLFCVD
jgi:hypothetical protein